VKLYEIPLEATAIEEQLYENAGELTPELEERIRTFLAQGKDKIESAAIVVHSLEEDAEICTAEAKRLVARAAQLNRNAENLRRMILAAVDLGFGGMVKTTKYTIWGQNAAPVTNFELKAGADIYVLQTQHPEFVRARDPELDKVALKDAIKAEKPIPEEIAVTNLQGTRFLRIK
jgi:hypothetical protein